MKNQQSLVGFMLFGWHKDQFIKEKQRTHTAQSDTAGTHKWAIPSIRNQGFLSRTRDKLASPTDFTGTLCDGHRKQHTHTCTQLGRVLCSCLENPRDRAAWWAAVHGVAQSWTRLKWLSSSSSIQPNMALDFKLCSQKSWGTTKEMVTFWSRQRNFVCLNIIELGI